MKYVRLLKIDESSFKHVSYSKFGFFWKKVAIFRKNLKIDNFLYSIKNKTRQNKELKYCRKNIVCTKLKNKSALLFGNCLHLLHYRNFVRYLAFVTLIMYVRFLVNRSV